MTFFRKALALEPKDASALFGVGMVYRRMGMNEDAIFWLGRALAASPQETAGRARSAIAQACAECTDTKVGIQALERAIDLVGEDRDLMCALGQLHIKNGEWQKGYRILDRYLGSA